MDLAVETYLDRVMAYANRKGSEAAAIRDELRDHLLEKIERVRARGLPVEDAVFAAIEDNGQPRVVGYSLRPAFPLIDVRVRGTARGVVAIGPKAVGVFALGGVAIGAVAIGAVSFGLIGLGCLSMAFLFAWGALAAAPTGIAAGALVLGLVAVGVLAGGVIAAGWGSVGLWAGGPDAISLFDYHTIPAALRWIGPHIPTIEQQVVLFVAMLGVFLPAMALSRWAMGREERRLRKIDPSLRSE